MIERLYSRERERDFTQLSLMEKLEKKQSKCVKHEKNKYRKQQFSVEKDDKKCRMRERGCEGVSQENHSEPVNVLGNQYDKK